MSKILIIALEYLEPEWQETKKCIEATGLPVVYVSRDGVGNMSRAFNSIETHDTIWWNVRDGGCWKLHETDYFFFVTNITFHPDLPQKLVDGMEGYAAIHPAMKSSDHIHQHPDGSGLVKEVPFVEWTALMVRTDVFLSNPLDENLWYYYFDLVWSKEVKDKGHKVGVHHGAEIGHTYLRNKSTVHPVSNIRRRLRDYRTPIEQKYLANKYGPNWKQILNWK